MAGPDLEAEHARRLAQLDAAIRELPEEQRVILSMATAGGLTSREIGEALASPPAPSATGSARPASSWPPPSTWRIHHDHRRTSRPGRAARRLGAGPRLPDADAERIRLAIVPAVAAPSMTWWSEFNDKLSTAISRATSLPVPGLAGVQ